MKLLAEHKTEKGVLEEPVFKMFLEPAAMVALIESAWQIQNKPKV